MSVSRINIRPKFEIVFYDDKKKEYTIRFVNTDETKVLSTKDFELLVWNKLENSTFK